MSSTSPRTRETGLSVNEVSKSYGGLLVLDAVSLQAPAGSVTSVIGPNGAGKSTLANIISGFVSPDEGAVTVDGTELSAAHPGDRARHRLGRTFQNLEVFDGMTVLDNVMMGGYSIEHASLAQAFVRGPRARREERETRDRAHALLAEFGLDHQSDTLVDNLPFGEAKLVEMVRVVAMDPRVLVLDEPAAGLPPSSSGPLADTISHLAERDIAVLLIEHNMKLVMKISENIVVLDHGQLLVKGPPQTIREDPRVIEAYLGPGQPGDEVNL